MRWEYTNPEPKTYIYKDEVFLSYFPEDNQLWRQRLPKEQYETEILALLAGQARLAEKYIIESSPFPGGERNSAQLKLTPREEEGENAYILLEIDRKTWMVLRAIFFDWAGNKTEFAFSRIRVNPRFSKDLFDLKVPPDCEIIEDEGPRKK
jgi:outer membrane lipoprotein-sorting protein